MRKQIAPGRFSSPKNGLGPRLTGGQKNVLHIMEANRSLLEKSRIGRECTEVMNMLMS